MSIQIEPKKERFEVETDLEIEKPGTEMRKNTAGDQILPAIKPISRDSMLFNTVEFHLVS